MKNKNTKFYIIGAALVVALLIGFGGNENRELANNQFGGDNGNANQNEQAPPQQNAPVGNFTLKTLDGEDLSLSDYKDEKPVILDFWASWCPNCRRDMPKLSSYYDKYKDDVEVIGVNLQERQSVAQKYVDSAGISFPIVLDPGGVAARQFGVQYTNYHVLINKDGTLAGVVPGDISEAQVLALIESQPIETDELSGEQQIEITGDGNLDIEILE